MDPFGTAELRRRVLEAWRQSPARLRADANVEDDLALTGYRDRVVVELAQNAADAATRAGVTGRLVLALEDRTLTASNTGAPLDAAGVESISVARASAKLDEVDTVGRFGVGFAAVLAVTDEPAIVSRSGGVRWSRSDAFAIVAESPELAGELEARGDRLPVLRLPLPADEMSVTDGDTSVVLPLRDDDSIEAVRAQLADLDPTLLLALPALGEIVIRLDGNERVLRAERTGDTALLDDGTESSRWHLATGAGALPLELLADRPIEEQRHDTWQVTWAIPVDDADRVVALPDSVAGVIRAPTAVDDPLTLPAVVIASYPLDSNRRRVTPSPLADAVTAQAADVLTDAIVDLPADPSILRLLPSGLPNGEIDGALHAAVLDRLAETPWLPLASDEDMRQRPREAVVVADELVEVLSEVVPVVLPAGWSRPELVGLGVRRPEVAELVDELGEVHQPAQWWWRLYAALDVTVAAGPDRDALGALPVPLVDGTVVTGPRGLVLPESDASYGDLSVLGIRVVHPAASHPMLHTLGAVDGTPRDLLDQPQVSAAVAASYDEDDPTAIANAVLSLLAMIGVGADEMPWLSELALTDATGEWRPAGELVLPDGWMATSIASDSAFGVVADEWIERFGREAVAAAGVLDGPAVLRGTDAVGPAHDLDDEESWWATLPRDSAVEEFVAVRDLEQVRESALSALLDDLALPPLRAAVVDPAIVTLVDGHRVRVPSYTAWWLSSRPVIDGHPPRDLRLPHCDPRLAPLYDVAVSTLDEEFLRALGVLGSLADADPDDVLERLADPRRTVSRAQLRALDCWIAGLTVEPPTHVRAVRDGAVVVVPAEEAVVVDAPDLIGLLGALAVVPVPVSEAAALADLIGVPLASHLADFEVRSTGVPDGDSVVHDPLCVADVNGADRRIAWRLVDGALHVDREQLAVGLGRGRAWREGAWSQRHRRTEALMGLTLEKIRDDEDDLDIGSEV